ncbi:uncharacterized protein N7459_001406 [Penicillium hispanicum]|uniref:uncharacterized protein n=1 Tax=Penicillium hispanicum TaxID=1080232 RepID=UPI00254196B3|nr:uncharacterized protein N7459_001406 [Penicillium hispanicum]KAJ5595198.1 hypothetical protein N7459_001406 [Penicillium hispanicum]
MVDLITMGNATVTPIPGVFEVDLISPRNATYTPQSLMPIVFALQNPTLDYTLGASISWDLWEGNNRTSPGSITGGLLEPVTSLTYPPASDPLFVTRFINTMAYPDGFWTFAWSLQLYHCSPPGCTTKSITTNNAIVFTVSQSGQASDLVAATSFDVCGTMQAYAFNVTSVQETYGVLGPSPTTNPCAATINASAASSISAAATAYACSPLQHPLYSNVTCPPLTGKSSNDAEQSRMAAASTLLTLLIMLTVLIHHG